MHPFSASMPDRLCVIWNIYFEKEVDDNCPKGKKGSFRGLVSNFETFQHFFLIRFFYVLALSSRGSRLCRVRRFQTASQRQESSGYLEHLATTHLLFFLERRARQNLVTCACATLRHFFYRQHRAPGFTWRYSRISDQIIISLKPLQLWALCSLWIAFWPNIRISW